MTLEKLASLPVGTTVLLNGDPDEEPGEIVQAGKTVHILWAFTGRTLIIPTVTDSWAKFVADLKTT